MFNSASPALGSGSRRSTFDVGQHHLIAAAQLVKPGRPVMVDSVAVEEIVGTFENISHSGESGLHHGRRGHAATGQHSGEVECLFDVVHVGLP